MASRRYYFRVLGAAALFEMLQVQEPSRHGRVFDAAVKMAGGIIGLNAGLAVRAICDAPLTLPSRRLFGTEDAIEGMTGDTRW